jgi:D-alanyl-D-alanine carboxypeptidase
MRARRRQRVAPAARLAGRIAPLALLAFLSACGGGTGWNGRRGYDGHGDYGYDVNASRAAASNYRLRAARSYPVPGTPDDPCGPYIEEAASRYAIPDRWIRAIMQQESGGRLVGADGSLTTSSVGAMGLMQVMPATYDMLRRREALGDDPYEPHDNILAGASYIREMYDRFGAPGFVAAYNAGPDRLAAYLAGSSVLPDETVNYLAQVTPRLGNSVAMTGPLASFAGNGAAVASLASTGGGAYDPNAAYAGGGMVGTSYALSGQGAVPASSGSGAYDPNAAYAGGGMVEASYSASGEDPSDRAYDGGGLVTPDAPTGEMTGRPVAAQPAMQVAPVPTATPYQQAPTTPYQSAEPRSVLGSRFSAPVARASYASQPPMPVAAPVAGYGVSAAGGWGIQVGAFPDPSESRAAVAAARSRAAGLLAGAQVVIEPVQHGGTLFRARLIGLSEDTAALACSALSHGGTPCFMVRPGS